MSQPIQGQDESDDDFSRRSSAYWWQAAHDTQQLVDDFFDMLRSYAEVGYVGPGGKLSKCKPVPIREGNESSEDFSNRVTAWLEEIRHISALEIRRKYEKRRKQDDERLKLIGIQMAALDREYEKIVLEGEEYARKCMDDHTERVWRAGEAVVRKYST